MSELKAKCFSCASDDLLLDTEVIEGAPMWFIECLTCGIVLRNRDRENLIAAWNTRPLEDALTARAGAANARAEKAEARAEAAEARAERLQVELDKINRVLRGTGFRIASDTRPGFGYVLIGHGVEYVPVDDEVGGMI